MTLYVYFVDNILVREKYTFDSIGFFDIYYVPTPHLQERGHIVQHGTFLSAQYLVNQWLDSYQIFMDI